MGGVGVGGWGVGGGVRRSCAQPVFKGGVPASLNPPPPIPHPPPTTNQQQQVEDGVRELVRAEKHQKSGRAMRCIVVLCVLIFIFMLITIIRHT
jgi:hypothetical protein